MDVNKEFKFLGECTQKIRGSEGGVRWGGRVGGGQGGCERNAGGGGRCGVWGM